MQVEVAKRAAAQAWGASPSGVWVEPINDYPWVRSHQMFLAKDSSFRLMIVAVSESGDSVAFADPKGIPAVNRLLTAEKVALPDQLAPTALAATVRTLLLGPGGFVGSHKFYQNEKGALYMWASPRPADGPALFEKHCKDPVLKKANGGWTLEFFYFNNRGGVEKWKVCGDSHRVTAASVEPALADRTFFFPYG